ncbi:DUF1365 family protein [Streptomyces sedi]|uniref:DUF1365 family protein n=1 Tax=Streptomyces sedi TaxID=555059 RepID=A0A5C4V7K9_9ACTN|nr:DUF1365 family protein [Streptomyces sedi]
MLAHARVLGHVFNPLTVYWCHRADSTLACVVAEVHNTYGQRHRYLLHPDESGAAHTAKEFHVSPFFPVDGAYRLRLPPPGERLALSVRLDRAGGPAFVATVRGTARRADAAGLLRAWLRNPASTLAVSAHIRWHGVRLWLRGLPVRPRPSGPAPQTHPREGTEGNPVSTTHPHRPTPVDAARWPDVARVPAVSPARAATTRALVRRALRGLELRVSTAGGPPAGASGPLLEIADPGAFHARLGRHGLIGFGESYLAREWDSPELVPLLTELAVNAATLVPGPLQRLRRLWAVRQPPAARNTPDDARRNIGHHYDLSNELFALFLDPTLSYSSALFDALPAAEDALPAAQHRKIDRLLDLARVGPGTRLLEIGTGWGELALRAAARGATVHTVTLSEEQLLLARRRIADAGHAGRVTVALADYRQLEGRYDAVVSVEMIEAVGARHWPTYFRVLDRLTAPGGRVALQAIVMPHDRMLASRSTHTWVQKYVFPGGLLPSREALTALTARHTRLTPARDDGFGAHYAETLRLWRERFAARRAQVLALGFDETFLRMWTLYLAYSEAGFRSGYLDVRQLLLTDPRTGGTR